MSGGNKKAAQEFLHDKKSKETVDNSAKFDSMFARGELPRCVDCHYYYLKLPCMNPIGSELNTVECFEASEEA